MRRMGRVRISGRAAVMAGALLALGVAGCDRKPRLIPRGPDSTAVTSDDSVASVVDRVRSSWEQGGGDGASATASAAILVADLRLHPALALAGRARTFLDSVGLGAEVDGRNDIVLVNFFSPADPNGGSWPQLIWRNKGVVNAQAVEGSGMRLSALAVLGGPAGRDSSARQAAALMIRAAASGPQPLVLVWHRAPDAARWTLSQTLGPDSLGGVGTARFVSAAGESGAIETRTWQRSSGFDECPTCPHVYALRRLRWGPDGFATVSAEVEDGPYLAFVRLVQALSVPDLEMARERVTDATVLDQARGFGFADKRGTWRLAPGSESEPSTMTFFRGPREAYQVFFARVGGVWKVSALQAASRAIE